MKFIKKLSVVLLSTALVVGSVFVGEKHNSYAATSCKKVLKMGKTYKYDLDGDGDKDTIKSYAYKGDIKLKVNKYTYTIVKNGDELYDIDLMLYDFNKKDKSLEIVASLQFPSLNQTRIFKFKNSECKVNKLYNDAVLKSYSPSTGEVTFSEYEFGRYNDFFRAIGCFECYSKIKVYGYNITEQKTAKTTSHVRKNKYVVAKPLTAYTSTSGSKKAFTISKGSTVYVYSLYKNGDEKYIKVKNKQGKYGYVKVEKTMLFVKKSCLWWR